MQMNQERVDELVPRKETVVKQKLIDKINALGADSSTTAKDLTYLSKSLEVLNKKVKAIIYKKHKFYDDLYFIIIFRF